MSNMNKLIVKFFKVLANPTRLAIIEFLMDGEKCACEIHPVFSQSQSTISIHLKKLVNAGILSFRQDGVRKMYSIKDRQVLKILEIVKELIQKWNKEKIQELLSLSSESVE
ncbi:MAG: ArsR/SmtB family transcription factor [Candidatus Helarchaeota archaeon]